MQTPIQIYAKGLTMALFRKKETETSPAIAFNFDVAISEIKNWAEKQGYLALDSFMLRPNTDLIFIRSVKREVKITINSLNPYSRHEEQEFQQVFWICIAGPDEIVNVITDELSVNNQTAFIIVSSLDQLKRRLEDF